MKNTVSRLEIASIRDAIDYLCDMELGQIPHSGLDPAEDERIYAARLACVNLRRAQRHTLTLLTKQQTEVKRLRKKLSTIIPEYMR